MLNHHDRAAIWIRPKGLFPLHLHRLIRTECQLDFGQCTRRLHERLIDIYFFRNSKLPNFILEERVRECRKRKVINNHKCLNFVNKHLRLYWIVLGPRWDRRTTTWIYGVVLLYNFKDILRHEGSKINKAAALCIMFYLLVLFLFCQVCFNAVRVSERTIILRFWTFTNCLLSWMCA